MDPFTFAVVVKLTETVGKVAAKAIKIPGTEFGTKAIIKYSLSMQESIILDLFDLINKNISENNTKNTRTLPVANAYSLDYDNIYKNLSLAIWLEKTRGPKSAAPYYYAFYRLGAARLLHPPQGWEFSHPIDYRMRLAEDLDFFEPILYRMGIIK